jgi:hypothetical protein
MGEFVVVSFGSLRVFVCVCLIVHIFIGVQLCAWIDDFARERNTNTKRDVDGIPYMHEQQPLHRFSHLIRSHFWLLV